MVGLLFVGSILAVVHPASLSRELLCGIDSEMVGRILPVRDWFFGNLSLSSFPFWNSYLMGGMPVVESVEAAVFYPPVWVHSILPAVLAANIILLWHLFLAAWGAWFLARTMGAGWMVACVAGIIYSLSGLMLMDLQGGRWNEIMAAAWGPFLFAAVFRLLAERPAFLLGGVALAGLFLSGSFGLPLIFLVTAGIVLLAGLILLRSQLNVKRAIGIAGGAVIFWGGLSAAQWLPLINNFPVATHLAWFGDRVSGGASLPAERLLGLLFPRLFVSFHGGGGGEGGVVFFLGSMALVLAGWAILSLWRSDLKSYRVTRGCMAVLLVVSLIFALGVPLVFYRLASRFIPLALLPQPTDFLYVVALSVAALAGCGCQVILDMRGEALRRTWRPILFIAFSLGVIYVLFFYPRNENGDHWKWWTQHLIRQAERVEPGSTSFLEDELPLVREARFDQMRHDLGKAIVLLALFAGAVGGAVFFPRVRPFLGPILLGLLLMDILDYAAPRIRSAPADETRWPKGLENEMLARQGSQWRFSLSGMEKEAAFATYAGVRVAYAWQPTASRDALRLWNLDQGGDPELPAPFLATIRHTPFLDRWSVRWGVFDEARGGKDFPGWIRRGDLTRGALYENPDALPRARFTSSASTVSSVEEALMRIDSGRNGEGTVYLSTQDMDRAHEIFGKDLPSAPSPGWRAVEIISETPTRVVLSGNFASAGYVVLADVAAPGWRVMVDDTDAPLLKADGVMRCVALRQGSHRIEMNYRGTASARAGRWLSLGTIVLFVLWTFGRGGYNPRKVRESGS